MMMHLNLVSLQEKADLKVRIVFDCFRSAYAAGV